MRSELSNAIPKILGPLKLSPQFVPPEIWNRKNMEESLWNHVLTVKLICMVNVGKYIYIYVYHTYMDPKGSVFWKWSLLLSGLPAAYLSGANFFMLGTQGGDLSLVTLRNSPHLGGDFIASNMWIPALWHHPWSQLITYHDVVIKPWIIFEASRLSGANWTVSFREGNH